MTDINKENSEDKYTDIEFEDDVENKTQEKPVLKSSGLNISDSKDDLPKVKTVKKKSGGYIQTKYNSLGMVESVNEYDKDKKIIKAVDYYENGQVKLSTEYGPLGSYKAMAYNVDGTRLSYIEKHIDGKADAIYYGVDNKNSNLILELDENKQPIKKTVVDD